MEIEKLNLSSISKQLSDEEEAWKFLEFIRWPNGPICPHCGVVNHAYFLKPKDGPRKTKSGSISYRRIWKCGETKCRKKFSVLVGTIFEDSHIPLSKWILAYHLIASNKNGISAHELRRNLDLSHKAAWFMAHRIRYGFENGPQPLMTGIVEADEAWIGGRASVKGKGIGNYRKIKTPVVTLVQRDGEARSQALDRVTRENLTGILAENVDESAFLMTDENYQYDVFGKLVAGHEKVVHSKDEFVRGRAHVNTAEGYFSQLKRSIDGTHHHVSRRHLGRYLCEFDFRYNTRKIKDGERTVAAIRRSAGKRLMYDKVVGA